MSAAGNARSRTSGRSRSRVRGRVDRQTWVAIAFVILVFLMGGSSRSDISSLLVLRPLAFAFLAYGLVTAVRGEVIPHRTGLIGLGALVALHIAHLIPLPPAVWTQMPGRSELAENLNVAGMLIGWRPLSIVPFETWNGLFALAVPLAAFFVVCRVRALTQHMRIIYALLGLAFFSAILGLLQGLAPYDAGIYPYHISSRGHAVGLFANRNHNAVFLACAIPIGAFVYGAKVRMEDVSRGWSIGAFSLLALIVATILLTGSRAGLLVMFLAMLSIPLFVDDFFAAVRRIGIKTWAAAAVIMVSVAALVALSPENAVMRIFATESEAEFRFEIWPVIWREVAGYFPWGAGMGTFVDIYQIAEPDELLREQYINRAHNDWLELLLDAGLAGALLLIFATLSWLWSIAKVVKAPTCSRLPRLGIVIIGLLALASVFDYALRTPSLAVLFVIAIIWTGKIDLPGKSLATDDY